MAVPRLDKLGGASWQNAQGEGMKNRIQHHGWQG